MCTINIKELLANRTYPEAGRVLYGYMVNYIDTEDKVVLDMDGVDSLPSMFLNTSIGKYIDDYGFESLRNKVSFARIGKGQADGIKNYIQRVVNK